MGETTVTACYECAYYFEVKPGVVWESPRYEPAAGGGLRNVAKGATKASGGLVSRFWNWLKGGKTGATTIEGNLSRLSLEQLRNIYKPQIKLLRELFNRPGKTGLPSAQQALAEIKAGGDIPPGLTREVLLAYREIAARSLDANGVQAVRIQIIDEVLKRVP